MEIRPVKPADLGGLYDIDGTIESDQYLHLDRTGEGLDLTWKIADRRLREKRHLPNRLDDERSFLLKQIATGVDDGTLLIAEHDDVPIGLLLAQVEPVLKTIRVHDVRIDFDHRRQGLATAMMYQLIATARELELRAVTADCPTDNFPAAQYLQKCGFELTGFDTHRLSNHDLVKESVTLHWYVALD